MRARHWYHCTDRRSDSEWVAQRRAPLIRADSEPETPRLCVAPSVAQALVAVWWFRDVTVYITPMRRTVPPSGVFDACMTQERWIIPPVKLTRVGVIPFDSIHPVQLESDPREYPGYRAWERRAFRLEGLCRAVRAHLPDAHAPSVERFAAKCREFFDAKQCELEEERAKQWGLDEPELPARREVLP
jgi:hypothetical protein